MVMALDNNVFATMFVQQLHYWIEKGKGFFYKGQKWIWNSHKDWTNQSNLPFLSLGQIRSAIDYARKIGVVKSEFLHVEHIGHTCDAWNRRLYYTIDYDRLKTIIEDHLRKSTNESARQKNTICSVEQDITKKTSTENFQGKHHTQEREEKYVSTNERVREKREIPPEENYSFDNELIEDYWQDSSSLKEEKVLRDVVHKKDVVLKKNKEIQLPIVTKEKPLAPWNSTKELKAFYRELVTALPRLGARVPEAVAAKIIQELKNGIPSAYWEDWKEGLPIGTTSMQEWEINPGVVAPKFVEYLKEKLKKTHDTDEMALERVGNLLKDKTTTNLYWNKFKRVLEALRQKNEEAVANGLQPYLPVWFIDRADITLDRAAESANYLSEVNPTSDWIDNGIKGSKPAYLLPQSEFDIALSSCVRELTEAAKYGYVCSAKRYVAIAQNLAKSEEDKARLSRAIADIYPELFLKKN